MMTICDDSCVAQVTHTHTHTNSSDHNAQVCSRSLIGGIMENGKGVEDGNDKTTMHV